LVRFLLRRLGLLVLSAFALTLIVFLLTNLQPNLEKLAKVRGNARMSDAEVTVWLADHGYDRPFWERYGEWLGVRPGWTGAIEGGRCARTHPEGAVPRYCGLLQGDLGWSTVFGEPVAPILEQRLGYTAVLMGWVMAVMVPAALAIGVISGMRAGSRTDRVLTGGSILATATPEYVSGVVLIALFASSVGGLKWFKGSAASAMDHVTFENFTLPVATLAIYLIGYVARMTRTSMIEVMRAPYIRTARLKGLPFASVVLKHALRNALLTPFTVIMLQIPWLLTGVVIDESLFNYKGFGWTLVQAAGNNDIELMLGCSVVAVTVVLATQLVSDLGYALLNPRIRVS